MSNRPYISKKVVDKLLVDCMHRCCLCPEHHNLVDKHHIELLSDGGPNTEKNLIAVCPTCHAKIHRRKGQYNKRQLIMYKMWWVNFCKMGLPLDARIAVAPWIKYNEQINKIESRPLTFLAHPYSLQSKFTGRIEERKNLTHWLCHDNDHPVISLTAIGGMGKSALSWVWLNLDVLREKIPGLEVEYIQATKKCNIPEEHRPDGVFQWSFYLGELSFSKFLIEACKYTGGDPEIPADQEKVTDNDRLRVLIQRMRENRYLFILDGFERLLRAYGSQDAALLREKDVSEYSEDERRCSDPNVSSFLMEIVAGIKSKVLLTTRLVPYELQGRPGFKDYSMIGLNKEDAVTFLKSMDISGLDRELLAVAKVYDNHPLSLSHLVNVIRRKSLDGKNDISLAPEIDVTMDLRGKNQQILEKSFEILPENLKKTLMKISAVKGSISYDFFKLVNDGLTDRDLGNILPTLMEMQWIFWDRNKGLVNFHPLARRYCYQQMKEEQRIEVHETLRKYWEERANEKLPMIADILSEEELRAIEFEQSKLIAKSDAKKKDELKITMPELEAGFDSIREMLKHIRVDKRIPLLDMILGLDSVPTHLKKIKVVSLDDLAPVIELYHHTVRAGRYDESATLLRDRLAYPIYFQFGAYHTEIELLRDLFVDGENKPPKLSLKAWQAYILNELAACYTLSGQPRRAVLLFEQYIQIHANIVRKEIPTYNWKDITTYPKREHSRQFSYNLGENAIGLGNLAGDQMKIADLESAEANLQRAIKLSVEIENKENQGRWNNEFGRTLAYLGDFEKCERKFNIANDLFEKLKNYQSIGVVWAYRSFRALLMGNPKEALKCANKALEFAKKWEKEEHRNTRDFIRYNWLIGASNVAMGDTAQAEGPLNFAITECHKINLVELEAAILLEIAKLEYLKMKPQINADKHGSDNLRVNLRSSAVKLAEEALEIANRCGYIIQQADIHLFLAQYYKDLGDLTKAREHAELGKLRSHQMIDVETGDYIDKPEDTRYKYKPCYDNAVKLISELGDSK